MSDPRVSSSLPLNTNTVRNIQQEAAQELAMQVESEEDLMQFFELSIYNPAAMKQRFRDLRDHKLFENEAQKLQKPEEQKIVAVEKAEDSAARFQKNNPELQARTLLLLRERINADDSPDEILRKVLEFYPDPYLADEALDFLIETARPGTLNALRFAKEKLNNTYDREIKAGRNMSIDARNFSKEGLGSPTSLRDLYRDITGNPREPIRLFSELTDLYAYDKLKTAIFFLLNALGSDFRAKGPSIDPNELRRLIDETRSLQGILGVFRFFQSRMALISKLFAERDLQRPQKLDFETLAKMLIRLLAERFVNPDKILQTARSLGIEDEITAQIIIYTQMREGLRQIAPRYYRNPTHKEELAKAFVDTLDKLEEDLEDEDDEEKEK